MNWLAHVFLSEQKIDQQVGNFLADPLKGRLWESASKEMHKGVALHKKIDSFTDVHKRVSLSKSRLRKKGLLKGVVIDLTYDYLLTKHWSKFSKIQLSDFLDQFYQNAQKRVEVYPDNVALLVLKLVQNDRLNKYHTLDQLYRAFERIDMRLSPRLLARESATSYYKSVEENMDALEKDFLLFFPELCEHVRSTLEYKHFSHWNI